MNRRHSAARRLLVALTTLGVTASLLSLGAVPASAGACTGPTVAAIGADDPSFQDDVVAKLAATCLFTQVDEIDAFAGTPTLGTLNAYDAVLVYSDMPFADNVAMGNVLADYVDGGGRVVVGAFSFMPSGVVPQGIGGRLSTGGYLPFTQGSIFLGGGDHLVLEADLPQSPYLTGVDSFDGGLVSYSNQVGLTSGATQIAHWSDSSPLVAVKGDVVGLNLYPPSSDAHGAFWDASTDGDILMANALLGGRIGPPFWEPQVTVGPGLETQTKTIAPGRQSTFVFTITNAGNVLDRFTVLGADDAGLVIRYYAGRSDVTAAVLAGTYRIHRRSPGRARKIKLEVHVPPDATTGVTHEIAFVATSVGDPTRVGRRVRGDHRLRDPLAGGVVARGHTSCVTTPLNP